MKKIGVVMVLVWMGSISLSAVASPWLTADEYGAIAVVVSADAQENDQLAAREFARYWEQSTGHPVLPVNEAGNGITVWIGAKELPEAYLGAVDLDALAPDGLHIKSYDRPKKALVIVGPGERGTLNGVYEFFERFIGVRWLTPDVTFVPAPPDDAADPTGPAWKKHTPAFLPAIDHTFKPIFEYRWTTLHDHGDTNAFARANRLTREPGFGLYVHTLYQIVSPAKYFEKHPEYFSEVDGERVAVINLGWHDFMTNEDVRREQGHRFAQLCFTNPDLPEVAAAELLEQIRANPTPRIWSVSQMDWGGYCQCESCAALNEAESSPMGSMLPFVNRVAELVEEEFPEHYIETLAYTWSRRLPKTVRPRRNVIIRLCSIECDFARPLNDDSVFENRLFARDIRDWSQVATQLYIWDYTVNFHHYQLPHPNLHVLQDNVQFFAEHNVRGLFEQGQGATRGEQGYIRPYLLAKLIWDPYCDIEAYKDEFLDLFYQEAAPYIREYIALITKVVLDKEWMMNTFDRGGWIDKALIAEARAIFDEAERAATNDVIRERIAFDRLAIEYAALVAAPSVAVEQDRFIVEYPENIGVEAYIEMAKRFNVSEYAEIRPLEQMRDAISAPVETRVEHVIEAIENERYLLWVTPTLEGSIIRWRDKSLDVELINGFREYGIRPSTWQDWHYAPLSPEGPAAEQYEVVDRSDHEMSIRARSKNGLEITRTMRLESGEDALQVRLEIRNASDAPLAPEVKIHPEFYDQGGFIPEIWGRRNSVWTRIDAIRMLADHVAHGEYLQAENYTGLAAYLPEQSLSVVCEFETGDISGLLWFYNASQNARQINLELLPETNPLAPGASIVLEGRYYTVDKSPEQFAS